jgi:hypothetical protein
LYANYLSIFFIFFLFLLSQAQQTPIQLQKIARYIIIVLARFFPHCSCQSGHRNFPLSVKLVFVVGPLWLLCFCPCRIICFVPWCSTLYDFYKLFMSDDFVDELVKMSRMSRMYAVRKGRADLPAKISNSLRTSQAIIYLTVYLIPSNRFMFWEQRPDTTCLSRRP